MSLLWKDVSELNLLIIFERPSPKHNKYIPCFAQSKNPYLNNKVFAFSKKFFQKMSRSIKGISLLISGHKCVKGSMTVEASLVLPLFFFFFLNVGSAIEMIRLHGNLQLALWDTGNRMAVYGTVLTGEEEHLLDMALSGVYVKGQVVDYLGEAYLEHSPLKAGVDSLMFWESDILNAEDTFEITVTYSVSPISALSGFRSFRMANKYYGHFWNGYDIPVEENAGEQYVYVTENGEVYHITDVCTHLKLSITQVRFAEVLKLRNEDGERYTACEKCGSELAGDTVFITLEGDRYHSIRECSGLKRTIYYVPLSQVGDFRGCQRCVK